MGRIHIKIKDNIEDRFRKRFVRKKGDLSKKIEECMQKELKLKLNTSKDVS